MFSGSYVAIVTPFANGRIDYDALEKLIELHVESGTAGLVPCGTTGESPTLTHAEHKEIIKFVVERVNGRISVIAGTGSNSTAEAIDLTVAAREAGADASLQVAPYYNKPEPEGAYRHFRAIAEASRLPMILYNIPGRTGRAIEIETILRLADDTGELVAVKAADGSLDNATILCRLTDLDVLSGDDSLTWPLIAVGAKGVISVVANFVPADMARFIAAALGGRVEEARTLHHKLFPLFRAAFIESNPIPVKTAMGMLGMCSDELRLPLSAMAEGNRDKLAEALKDYGLSVA